MWQTEYIVGLLEKLNTGHKFEIVPMSTKGDKILDVALSKIGDKGLFTEALEKAMVTKEIDMAVHSLKDMPTKLPNGLALTCFSDRHDPSDAWLSKNGLSISDLPKGAIVGTSSLRRIAQVKQFRPDIQVKDLRGNVQTRLDKFYNDDFDAVVLATAGLERLGLEEHITSKLDPKEFIPAVGQGVVAVESRDDDEELLALLSQINNDEVEACILAERAFLRKIEGGCQAPIGAYATIENDTLTINGFVSALDGGTFYRSTKQGHKEDAVSLGEALADDVIEQGAEKVLKEIMEKA